jgi:hypothetical protein
MIKWYYICYSNNKIKLIIKMRLINKYNPIVQKIIFQMIYKKIKL